MEDYQAAFIERHVDTQILSKSRRKVAAIHFGGISIECQLKAIVSVSLPRGISQNLKTHSYLELLKQHNKLKSRIDKFPEVRKWLEEVENPISQHFIDMRYSRVEPNKAIYKSWFQAYQRLKGWLQREAPRL